MEVKIGIQSVPRELVVETQTTAEDIERDLAEALGSPGGILRVATAKDGRVLVPADKVAYLEFIESGARPVGFGNR